MKSPEQKILKAAKKVFQKKGFAGARMREIADSAGINKGLLHYYFRTKEKIFSAVFMESFMEMIPIINEIFNADMDLFQKIESFTEKYITIISQNPLVPSFVIHELNQNPEKFIKHFIVKKGKPNPSKFIQQIKEEVEKGTLRSTEPTQLPVNMISMCIFPFIAKPMFQTILDIEDKKYDKFINERKTEVARFIINSIKP